MCATGITTTTKQRDELQQVVEALGGVYMGDMDVTRCTVLLASDESLGSSQKAIAAGENGIPIVSLEWLRATARFDARQPKVRLDECDTGIQTGVHWLSPIRLMSRVLPFPTGSVFAE